MMKRNELVKLEHYLSSFFGGCQWSSLFVSFVTIVVLYFDAINAWFIPVVFLVLSFACFILRLLLVPIFDRLMDKYDNEN